MIRKAENEDAEIVADIYIGSRRMHVGFAPLAHSDDAIRKWIRTCLIPGGGVSVVENKDGILAMMATSTDEQGSWIDQLYVGEEFTGKGFGSLLLKEALRILPRPIRLYTFQRNEGARRFYERYGFRAKAFSDGSTNEEKCPDVLYILENE